jgi:uncharacterized protein YecA (UPF0149 family)
MEKEKVKKQNFRVPYKRKVVIPNRNELCPCGSGKKFKRCCGSRMQDAMKRKIEERRANKG